MLRETWLRFEQFPSRKASFAFSPALLKRQSNSLASAGLFYQGEGVIQCFACELQFISWNSRCNPWQLHTIESLNCFVILTSFSPSEIISILNYAQDIRLTMGLPDGFTPNENDTYYPGNNENTTSTPHHPPIYQSTPLHSNNFPTTSSSELNLDEFLSEFPLIINPETHPSTPQSISSQSSLSDCFDIDQFLADFPVSNPIPPPNYEQPSPLPMLNKPLSQDSTISVPHKPQTHHNAHTIASRSANKIILTKVITERITLRRLVFIENTLNNRPIIP